LAFRTGPIVLETFFSLVFGQLLWATHSAPPSRYWTRFCSHTLATAVAVLTGRVLLLYENLRVEITHLLTDDG
jgi:hypothetical protein